MKILVLGGTGAIGVPLVNLLLKDENQVYVTSRSQRSSEGNLHYVQGNAKEETFLGKLMEDKYDVIVDFMIYKTEEFKKRLPILIDHTKQYFFFSSSRVYADSKTPITEDSLRLLDVTGDQDYLVTDEYALAKAREENVLRECGKDNWTIIRPYITYNSYRLQLGVYEKENWLKRALNGRTIVFPKDIAEARTSLTYGPDVAASMLKLVGNEKAYGETFHVVIGQSATWSEILECYLTVIEKRTGKCPKVKLVENSNDLQNVWSPWQIKYDRLFSRVFDNSKIEHVRGKYEYKELFTGLEECLNEFLDNPQWLGMNWKYEAYCDRVTGERFPLSEIPGNKMKLKYLKWRYLG